MSETCYMFWLFTESIIRHTDNNRRENKYVIHEILVAERGDIVLLLTDGHVGL